MNIGYLLIGVSILILITVLYGQNRRREEFTNMKGNYPSWDTIMAQVKSILDKHYEYDVSKLAELATQQHDLYAKVTTGVDDTVHSGKASEFGFLFDYIYKVPTPQLINEFNKNKDLVAFLPKGVVLNVDTPFDTRMAMIYAASEYAKAMVKKAKNANDILIGYSLSYAAAEVSGHLKNAATPALLTIAVQTTNARLKPSDFISVISK